MKGDCDRAEQGYAKVAGLISSFPELANFRRFQTLNLQNLLYMQAEITHLESDLKELATEDVRSGKNLDHHHDWWSLAHDDSESAREQWTLIQKIREKLEMYNDAVYKQSMLFGLDSPSKHDVQFFRDWLERPRMGAFPLLGLDADSWEAEHEHDLMSLLSHKPRDVFSKWLSTRVIPFYHRILGRKYKKSLPEEFGSGLYQYSDKSVRQITRFASTIIASTLPLLSITILYTVKSSLLRMGITAILTGLFAMALSFMTNARGIEVFTATAAFAAINGAYLSNTNAN